MELEVQCDNCNVWEELSDPKVEHYCKDCFQKTTIDLRPPSIVLHFEKDTIKVHEQQLIKHLYDAIAKKYKLQLGEFYLVRQRGNEVLPAFVTLCRGPTRYFVMKDYNLHNGDVILLVKEPLK